MELKQNIQAVLDKIAAAARAAGRDPAEITLCAATKVQTDDTIRAAIAAGLRVCGENRAILTAIEQQDADEAERLMGIHVENARKSFFELMG